MEAHPLIQVAEDVETHAKSAKVAVIFDLDSTLFCVSPRIQTILRQLGSDPAFTKAYAKEAELFRDVEVLPTDWGVRTVFQRKQVQPSEDLVRTVRNYWRQHFFSSRFLHVDEIYPSANEYVSHLHELGAEVLYLTGRPDKAMRPGTIKALAQWGFPFFEDSRLIMKPSDVMVDENFKAEVLKELVHKYDYIWFFENEPVIIDLVRVQVPQVRIVYVHSTHSGRADPPKDLPTIGMSYREGLRKKT
jgi:phosphoserine phosphatase